MPSIRSWALLACLFIPANAIGDDVTALHSFGIGNETCADWQASRSKDFEGTAWVLGFWSGANLFNKANHMVGQRAGGPAILAEVRKACAADPSATLLSASGNAYEKLWQLDR